MLSIGRSNYMRFNHPAEAKHLRSVLPHSRISMASISFALSDGQSQENHQLERKPPVAPRKSPRNSCSDDEIGFLGKLTKFEMLSKQSRSTCVSPKVFPAGALTTNVPADQILGHSRSSSLVSLTKSPINGCNAGNIDHPSQNPAMAHQDETRQRSDSRLGTTPSRVNAISSQNHNQIRMYAAEAYTKTCKPCHREDGNRNTTRSSGTNPRQLSRGDLMSRSMTCQGSSELSLADHLADSRDFDMSQSLIVTKTTTTEFLQLEKYGSNPSVCNAGYIGDGDANLGIPRRSAAHSFGSSSSIKRIQPPSPAFNRNPRYSEQKRVYAKVKSPTPSAGSNCSLEELRERQADAESKRKEAETRRKQAQEERLREQEVERQEKMRLEEIVAMCTEYERQSAVEKPRQPNR